MARAAQSYPRSFPSLAALELEFSFRVVAMQNIASHVQRLLRLNISTLFANHDTKLDFPINLLRILRDGEIVIRPGQRSRSFEKDNASLGISILLSRALSRKFKPTQTILLGGKSRAQKTESECTWGTVDAFFIAIDQAQKAHRFRRTPRHNRGRNSRRPDEFHLA